MQASSVPLMDGNTLTLMVLVVTQPFISVKVISAVPAETPVTSPDTVIVATVSSEDAQGLLAAGALVELNCIVDPSQTSEAPEITGN
jgi:hypothetical protein